MRYKAVAMRWLGVALVVLVLGVAGYWAMPQTPLRQTFDTSSEGWFAFGTGTTVRVTHSREDVRTGGALEIEYAPQPQQFGSAVRAISVGSLAAMRGLRFWVKTDHDTAVALILTEAPPGGSHAAWFWSSRNTWHQIALTPADFAVAEGPSDPRDENGRLDVAAVQAIGILDLGQFFIKQGTSAYPIVIDEVTGTHHLHIDEFDVSTTGEPASTSSIRIGDPARGLLSWITLGGAQLSLDSREQPFDSPAVRATYERRADQYVLLVHGLSTFDLSRAARLTFQIASIQPVTVVAYLEERSPGADFGPRYVASLEVRGGSAPVRGALSFSDFVFDTTGPADADGRLTPGRLKSIALIDVTSPNPGAPARNTLWLSAMEAVSP